MRFFKLGGCLVAGLLVSAIASQTALAQREEGRRGRGGPGGGMSGPPTAGALLRAKEVQEALKLTDEQQGKIEKINDETRDEMRKLFEDGFDREKMMEIANKTSEKLNEVLDAGQQKRLMGILVQVNGASAVSDPAVAKELNITEDQKKELQEVRMSAREEMRGLRDLSDEERGKKLSEVQANINKKMLAKLTDDQQKQLDDLKGEKVDIEMSQLRPSFGGRGERGERGERRRDRESKGEEKPNN